MKTKISKKVLSVFLAVMMMVTSIPMMAFTAFSAENTEAALKAAMTSFETKMAQTGTTTYTNTLAAYNAYVEAKATLDAATYGSATVNYAAAAEKLQNAVNAMQPWTSYTGTAKPSFYEDSTGGDYDAIYNNNTYVANLLYSPGVVDGNRTINTYASHTIEIWQPTSTVMLYDGKTAPAMPILVLSKKDMNARTSNARYIYNLYPCESASQTPSSNFATVGMWHGHSGSTDRNHNWTWTYVDTGNNYYQFLGDNATSSSSNRMDLYTTGVWGSYRHYWASAANSIKYIGGDSLTGYSQGYTVAWHRTTGDQPNDKTQFETPDYPIYVVNYKALLDQINAALTKLRTSDFNDYDEGGLSNLIAAIDDALTLNPNSYFTNVTDVQQSVNDCANAIKAKADKIKTELAAISANGEGYVKLRTEITNSKQIVTIGNTNDDGSSKYTTDSWNNFINAYNASTGIMANLTSTLYNDSAAAGTSADALFAAREALDPVAVKVDVTALTTVIDKFESYKNIFTPESYAQVVEVVNAAKTAVWGSVENYKVPSEAPNDSAESQALIAAQAENVAEAIKLLRLSMDTVIEANNGNRMSFEEARALEDEVKDHHDDYGNYATFTNALLNADEYVKKAAATEFTDFDKQYAEYVAEVNKIVTAYEGLTYSFVKIPDGTIAKSGAMVDMLELTGSDQGGQSVQFSYNANGVVIKTTHDAATIKYGTAKVAFGTSIADKDNNMLDSISIHATAPQIAGNGGKNHISGTGKQWDSTPNALSDEQKNVTYAGCLSYNGFSLTNLRYDGHENNYSAGRILTTSDGTQIKDYAIAETMDLTDIIGKTDGYAKDDIGWGGLFVKMVNDTPAYAYVSADLNYDVPATTKTTLSESTVPTSTTYNIGSNGDTYFGAVSIWNCQNTSNWAYYDYVTSATNSDPINTSVTVVDISYLKDLVDECNAVLGNANKYTTTSWNAFKKALEGAQANMNYTQLSASQILTQSVTKYNNLWKAYKALELKDVVVTFNYKDANGADTSTVLTKKIDDTLTQAEVNAIQPPQYIADNKTYTFNSWSPAVAYGALSEDATYTAVYDSVMNKADWDAFNTAKAQLLGKLVDDTYGVDALTAVNTTVDTLSYFYYTDAQKEATMADEQGAIDAQTAAINSLKDGLVPAELSVEAAKALVELNEDIKEKDKDRYDLSNFNFTYTQTVEVAGQSVSGIVYDTQAKLDAVIRDTLNSLVVMQYTVKVDGKEVGVYDYGTTVKVNADGQIGEGTKNVAWYYSYGAPSTDYEMTASKYSKTDVAYEFIVKGNTELTTVATETDGVSYAVKFVSRAGSGRTFDIIYSDASGNVTMPAAPAYAYYTFSNYSNGANAGDVITVTEDTTIFANYTADTSDNSTYTISYYSSFENWDFVELESSNTYNYNELASYENPDAYCWVSALYGEDEDGNVNYTFKLLAYGTSYSFYACQSFNEADGMGLVALTEADYKQILADYANAEYNGETAMSAIYDGQGKVISAQGNEYDGYTYPAPVATVSVLENVVPVYDENGKFNKFSMIGTFTLPEGYTMVESGILFTTNQGANLVVENTGNDGVVRMKSSKYTVGNQFVINVKAPASGAAVSFDYCAYSIIKDAQGNVTTVYSTTCPGTTAGF